jgi:hypothetical protein
VGFPINFVVQASPCEFIFNLFFAIFLERVAIVTLLEKKLSYFRRKFLRLNYMDVIKNTYIRI